MNTFSKSVILTSVIFTNLAFTSTKFISQYSIEGSFNSSIESHLPGAVDCSNKLIKSKEFSIRLSQVYGSEATPILAKIHAASFNFTFQPFYPLHPTTIASTDMNGLIKLNNKKTGKTLSSLTATVSHEATHNLGYKHDDNIFPDVAYTVGKTIEDLVEQGFCEGEPVSQHTLPLPSQVGSQTQSPHTTKKQNTITKLRGVFKKIKFSLKF